MDHKRNSDLHRRKKTLLKKIIKTGDQLPYCWYMTYRASRNHLIRKSKKKHTQYFFDAKNDMKKYGGKYIKLYTKGIIKTTLTALIHHME